MKSPPSPRMPCFAVVIPMYNEASGAARCVHEVCAVLGRIATRCGLIVVEDGSTDRTLEVLRSAALAHPKLAIVQHARNFGYGRAVRTGIEQAMAEGYDYVLFMD